MWQRNNGQAEDDLQFRFTAYLVSAVKRRRKDYLIQLYKRSSIESAVEVVYESEPSSEEVVLDRLPLMDVIENGALLEALQKLNERERQIFLAFPFIEFLQRLQKHSILNDIHKRQSVQDHFL